MPGTTEECPFCKPDIKEISFLSSPDFHVIYNHSPILPGHSLVIPKQHYESLLDLPLSLSHEMINLSMHAVRILMKIFHAEAFDWTIQDGEAAGQTVPHLHLHLIPRKTNDLKDPGDWYPELEKSKNLKIDSKNRKAHTKEELLLIVENIRQNIKGMSD